jgi:thiamine-monophosphate kinase
VTLGELGEQRLIERVRRAFGASGGDVLVGIGDDAACLAWPRGHVLLTTDTLIEDVHFRRSTATLREIGAKALVVNVSDIAAMGGEPRFALVALSVPGGWRVAEIDELYAGLGEAAARYGVALVGGDTCRSPEGLVVTITLVGRVDGPPLRRAGAKPGNAILVTGSLGAAAAGLTVLGRDTPTVPESALDTVREAHRRPTPRVAEGQLLRASGVVTAMIDLSDGLATDLGHIVTESAVGAVVHLAALPVAEATRRVAAGLGADVLDWALSGGEDYELCFAATAEAAPALAARLTAATGTPVTRIGEIRSAAEGLTFVDEAGRPVVVQPGFDHFRVPSPV